MINKLDKKIKEGVLFHKNYMREHGIKRLKVTIRDRVEIEIELC